MYPGKRPGLSYQATLLADDVERNRHFHIRGGVDRSPERVTDIDCISSLGVSDRLLPFKFPRLKELDLLDKSQEISTPKYPIILVNSIMGLVNGPHT